MNRDLIDHDNCQICSGDISQKWSKSNRFGSFAIFECKNCGFGFVNPTPGHDFIEDYYSQSGHINERTAADTAQATYETVQRRETASPNSSIDAQRMTRRIQSYRPGGAVLDVGCGYGWFSRQAKLAGYQVTSLEIADTERSIAAQLLEREPYAVTFEDFDSAPENFDVIIMSQVLEHAREPAEWIKKARYLLRSGGVLAIALPNVASVYTKILGSRDPYVIPPAHLNYFTPSSLRLLAERSGFEVLLVETLSRFPSSTFGAAGKFVKSPFNAATKLLDVAKWGAMINLYARAK